MLSKMLAKLERSLTVSILCSSGALGLAVPLLIVFVSSVPSREVANILPAVLPAMMLAIFWIGFYLTRRFINK